MVIRISTLNIQHVYAKLTESVGNNDIWSMHVKHVSMLKMTQFKSKPRPNWPLQIETKATPKQHQTITKSNFSDTLHPQKCYDEWPV